MIFQSCSKAQVPLIIHENRLHGVRSGRDRPSPSHFLTWLMNDCYREAVETNQLAREGRLDRLHDGDLGGTSERRRICNHWIQSGTARRFRRQLQLRCSRGCQHHTVPGAISLANE